MAQRGALDWHGPNSNVHSRLDAAVLRKVFCGMPISFHSNLLGCSDSELYRFAVTFFCFFLAHSQQKAAQKKK